MSDPFDPPPPPAGGKGDSWKESIAEFVDARVELVRHEAKEAGKLAAQKAVLVGILAGCAVLTWLLLLAGLIGLLAAVQQAVPWYGLTLIVAFLHLLGAVAALMKLRQPAAPSFPITRNELAKDKAWLESLKSNPRKPKR